MQLYAYIVNRSQSPPVCNLGQAYQITVFSKAFWVARGRCVLLRNTVTLSALSKGLVKRHGYRVKYPRSIPSLTVLDFLGREPSHVCKSKFMLHGELCDNGAATETFWLQYLDSGRGHALCVTPNCLQLATLLQLLSVSIYGYTTTTCAMQLYILSLILSDILWYSVIFRTVFYCWSRVLLVVSTVEFLRIPNGKAFSLAHRFKYSFGTCTGHVKDKTKNPTNTKYNTNTIISIATAAGDLS